MYNIPKDVPIGPIVNGGNEGVLTNIPDRVFNDFYTQTKPFQVYDGFQPSVMPVAMAHCLNDDEYNVDDQFNFSRYYPTSGV